MREKETERERELCISERIKSETPTTAVVYVRFSSPAVYILCKSDFSPQQHLQREKTPRALEITRASYLSVSGLSFIATSFSTYS